jgi:hypothetical protein
LVYGLTQKDSLMGFVKAGTVFLYTDDKGSSGSFVGVNIAHKRINALNYEDKWFECDLSARLIEASGSLYYS